MGKTKSTTDRAHPQASKAPPQDVKKFAKLVALLKEHLGQTAIQLQHLGCRPETDGGAEGGGKGRVHRVGAQQVVCGLATFPEGERRRRDEEWATSIARC